jgi:hypothetical protein
VQNAAKGRFPPLTSKCAWRSNLTAPYLIIITHGSKWSLAECLNAALQLPAQIKERHLHNRSNFKLKRAAALTEWCGLGVA